jgi:hypothetical protein
MSEFVDAICERLKEIEFPPVLPAKIMQGDRLLSTGRASLPTLTARGWFERSSEMSQDIPKHGISLKLSGTPDAIAITDFHRCSAEGSGEHYHFVIQEKA